MSDNGERYQDLKKLWPSLGHDELKEAHHNLKEYVTVCLRIHNRLENQRDTHEDSEEQEHSPPRQPDSGELTQQTLL